MIRLLIALLIGFLIGWGVLLKAEVDFTFQYLIILLALFEALSYGWLKWRDQAMDAKLRPVASVVAVHFIIAIIFGILIFEIGNAIGENLKVVAATPIAIVLLLNLYKIASKDEK
jgi:hypothetical protein